MKSPVGKVNSATKIYTFVILLAAQLCSCFASPPPQKPDGTEKRLAFSDAERDAAIAAAVNGMRPSGPPFRRSLATTDLPEGISVIGGNCYRIVVRLGTAAALSSEAMRYGIDGVIHLNAPNLKYNNQFSGESGVAENPAYMGGRPIEFHGRGGTADVGCVAERVSLIPFLSVHGPGTRAAGVGDYQVEIFERTPTADEAAEAADMRAFKHQELTEARNGRCHECKQEFVLCAREPSASDDRTHLDSCQREFRHCMWPHGTAGCSTGW